jgi:hypothetical protein
MFTCLPYSSHIAPAMTARNMTIVSQMGPTIFERSTKLRVLRKNLPVRLALPRANRVRDKVTQRVVSSWHFLGPHQGDPTSSSFVSESCPAGFLHAPPCGLASSHPCFPDSDYQESRLKQPGQNLLGGISPCLVL